MSISREAGRRERSRARRPGGEPTTSQPDRARPERGIQTAGRGRPERPGGAASAGRRATSTRRRRPADVRRATDVAKPANVAATPAIRLLAVVTSYDPPASRWKRYPSAVTVVMAVGRGMTTDRGMHSELPAIAHSLTMSSTLAIVASRRAQPRGRVTFQAGNAARSRSASGLRGFTTRLRWREILEIRSEGAIRWASSRSPHSNTSQPAIGNSADTAGRRSRQRSRGPLAESSSPMPKCSAVAALRSRQRGPA